MCDFTVFSLVIGATRAPAFGDGILAVAKRAQMTGRPETRSIRNR